MADDDWESRDFEEDIPKPVVKAANDKWEGEDEEEPAKDNWDDEDEDKPDSSGSSAAPGQAKSKKKLLLKIQEKERIAAEKLQREKRANMTPEELAAEKLRQLKLQEEAEIQMLQSAFGTVEVDIADPMTKADFDALKKKIVTDLRKYEKRVPFEDFLEDFIQELCLSLSAKRLRKVKTNVEALYFERNKAEKASTTGTGKGKGKPSSRAKLTVETDPTKVDVGYELDDYDDFM